MVVPGVLKAWAVPLPGGERRPHLGDQLCLARLRLEAHFDVRVLLVEGIDDVCEAVHVRVEGKAPDGDLYLVCREATEGSAEEKDTDQKHDQQPFAHTEPPSDEMDKL